MSKAPGQQPSSGGNGDRTGGNNGKQNRECSTIATATGTKKKQSDAKWRANLRICHAILRNVSISLNSSQTSDANKTTKLDALRLTSTKIPDLERTVSQLQQIKNARSSESPETLTDVREEFVTLTIEAKRSQLSQRRSHLFTADPAAQPIVHHATPSSVPHPSEASPSVSRPPGAPPSVSRPPGAPPSVSRPPGAPPSGSRPPGAPPSGSRSPGAQSSVAHRPGVPPNASRRVPHAVIPSQAPLPPRSLASQCTCFRAALQETLGHPLPTRPRLQIVGRQNGPVHASISAGSLPDSFISDMSSPRGTMGHGDLFSSESEDVGDNFSHMDVTIAPATNVTPVRIGQANSEMSSGDEVLAVTGLEASDSSFLLSVPNPDSGYLTRTSLDLKALITNNTQTSQSQSIVIHEELLELLESDNVFRSPTGHDLLNVTPDQDADYYFNHDEEPCDFYGPDDFEKKAELDMPPSQVEDDEEQPPSDFHWTQVLDGYTDNDNPKKND